MMKLLRYAIKYARMKLSGMRKIVYPRAVNFPVTNKCNLRCRMCNVWAPEHASAKDMTPDEVHRLFSQPLFQKVTQVGLSGGEPFVRKDLEAVVEKVCEALPALQNIALISNGTLPEIPARVIAIKKKLAQRGIHLDVELSIDGIGDVYETVRGVAGTYRKVNETFLQLHEAGLLTRISTTITRHNCNDLWPIYRFAREHQCKIHFRLGSLIRRLHNEDLFDDFALSERDKLVVIKFLENISYHYERGNLGNRLFYRSLIGQLQGRPRRSGCSWQTSYGVSLDPYGNLYYCFPRSEKVANLLEGDAVDINLLKAHRDKLEAACRHCRDCTHDYVGTPELGFVLGYFFEKFSKEFIYRYWNRFVVWKMGRSPVPARIDEVPQVRRVAVCGWYGTETLGDKAILAGIVENFLAQGLQLHNLTVLSLTPAYTRLTLAELDYEDVRVVDLFRAKGDGQTYREHDLFVFGGGPLCDVEPLPNILEVFHRAKRAGKANYIYGAGVGPLKLNLYEQALKLMLDRSDRACFRDTLTRDRYEARIPALQDFKAHAYIDPAAGYIMRHKEACGDPLLEGDYVLLALRDWPELSAANLTAEEYAAAKRRLDDQLCGLVEHYAAQGARLVLFPMHNYYIGGDDREYYLDRFGDLIRSGKATLIDYDYTPLQAINYFRHARFCVCMRFHSLVFAAAVNTPFLAIDYIWGGGKVSGFAREIGLEEQVLGVEEFVEATGDELVERLDGSLPDWDAVNSHLDAQYAAMSSYMAIEPVEQGGRLPLQEEQT